MTKNVSRELPSAGYFRKKVYTIKMFMPQVGTKVYNKLECEEYTVKPNKSVVLIGTRGEMWTVGVDRLMSTYKFATGKPITPALLNEYFVVQKRKTVNITTVPENKFYYAERVDFPKQFQVQTSWALLNGNMPVDPRSGNRIPHAKGDYILHDADPVTGAYSEEAWIVNGAVMLDTYKVIKTVRE